MAPKIPKSIISVEMPQFEDDVSLIEELESIFKKYGFEAIDMRADHLDSSIIYRFQKQQKKG